MSREERKAKVLAAGAAKLLSANYPWANALTYDYLERASGVDRRQIDRDFGGKQAMVNELVLYCTDADRTAASWRDRYEAIGTLMADPELSIAEAFRHIGTELQASNSTDQQLLSQLALWGFAHDDRSTRAALTDLYEVWDLGTETLMHRWFEANAHLGVSQRPGLTAREFAIVVTALAEGVGMRARWQPDEVADDLVGRVLIALISAWVDLEGDGRSVSAALDDLDRARDRAQGDAETAAVDLTVTPVSDGRTQPVRNQ